MIMVLPLCTSFLIALYHLKFHSVPILIEICSRQAYYTKYYRSQTGSSFAALSVFQGEVLSQIFGFLHVLNTLTFPSHHFSLSSISDTCRDISPENPFKTLGNLLKNILRKQMQQFTITNLRPCQGDTQSTRQH